MSFGRTADEIREGDNARAARFREQAHAAAKNRGMRPDERFEAETLAWVFARHEDEIDELNAVAARYQESVRRQAAVTARRRMVQSAADAIEKEWAAQARAAAVAEAERRIDERLGGDEVDEDALAFELLKNS